MIMTAALLRRCRLQQQKSGLGQSDSNTLGACTNLPVGRAYETFNRLEQVNAQLIFDEPNDT